MVLFAEQEVPESPITVNVTPSHNANLVRADGPGITKDGKKCFHACDYNIGW